LYLFYVHELSCYVAYYFIEFYQLLENVFALNRY